MTPKHWPTPDQQPHPYPNPEDDPLAQHNPERNDDPTEQTIWDTIELALEGGRQATQGTPEPGTV